LLVDVPVNRSSVNYAELALINTEPLELQFDPLVYNTDLGEQTLLQVDLGVGYWLIKDRPQSWIQGLAPTLELHYTTSLDNADVVTLPLANRGSGLAVVGANGQPIAEPNPTVGNRRGRVDILDITVGTTFLLGDRVTLATGFSFPLRTGDNRTFDYEYQLQLNYYFGTGRSADRYAPPGL
jgi:hypothetical protein